MSAKTEKRKSRRDLAMDGIEGKLRNYDRAPFLDLLAEYMECFPTREAIETFAEKYPDRYLAAMAQLARVAGYTDKTETQVNVNVSVRQMSDSQLEDKIREMSKSLGVPAPVLELTAMEAKPTEPKA